MDEFFEKAVDYTREAGKKVGEVATDLYAKGRDKVSEITVKSDLREAYRALGEYVYAVESAALIADDIKKAALLREISELNDKLVAIQQKEAAAE